MSQFFNGRRKLALTTVAFASGLVCLSAHAQAQQDPVQLMRVEVTGSNIKRLAAETASPVQVISRTEVKQTGANTVRQVLDTITATNTNELRDDGSSTSFAAGATGVGMRGLGKGATLVLLNGRRIANFGLADGAKETFVNIDSIPADVIDRVEILKDGASAIYGSDAMAGVINIITRRDYSGVGLSANYQQGMSPSTGKQVTAGIVAGKGDMARDRYNVLANLELYKREGYVVADVLPYYPSWHKQFVNPAFGDPSLVSYPGNLIKGVRNAKGEFVATAPRAANQACPASQLNSAKACTMNLNDINPMSDPSERANLYTAGRLAINENLEAFAEVSLSHTKTKYRDLPYGINNPGTPFRWFDGNAKVIQTVNKPVLAADNPANHTGGLAGLEYRFADNPDMWAAPATADQYRVMAGFRGTYGNWDWETAFGQVGADAKKYNRGAHRTHFINAIESGEYKVGGQNSQELLDRMFVDTEMKGENRTRFIDAKVSGEVAKLPAGALQMALGVDLRDEHVKIKSSDNVMAAQAIQRGSVWVEGDRKLTATFVELEGPIIKGMTANAALRYDKATGFEGRLSPKLGLRWELSPQLLLRGTYAGGFRAPNIPETLGKVGLTGFFNGTVDPRRCDTATAIKKILETGNANDKQDAVTVNNTGCNVSVPAMISANPNLKPELSTSKTFGFVFEPIRDFSVAVDYFHIERRDEIAYRDPGYVLARENKPEYAALIARQPVTAQDEAWAARANALKPGANLSWPTGQLITLLLQYENFGKTESSGIDLDLKGRFKVADVGTFTIGWQTTYALKSRGWDIDADDWRPNTVGLRNTPRVRSVLTTQWARGDWTAGLRFNYTTRTELNGDETTLGTWGESACQARLKPGSLPCYYGRDLTTHFNMAYTGIKNLRLSMNIGNLFHDEFPVDLRGGYGVRPRTIKVGAEYKF